MFSQKWNSISNRPRRIHDLLRYLIRLDNQHKSKPEQVSKISSDLTRMVEPFRVSLKNVRISDVAIEFDLFAKDPESKERAVRALASDCGRLLGERNLSEETTHDATKSEVVQSWIKLFNEQRFWECHEVMEIVWRKESAPAEKSLQQGMILAASALVHAQKNESGVCLGMLPRTLERLNRWEKRDYYGLDVELLRNYLEQIVETRYIQFQKI
jgi:uncharacterized protein